MKKQKWIGRNVDYKEGPDERSVVVLANPENNDRFLVSTRSFQANPFGETEVISRTFFTRKSLIALHQLIEEVVLKEGEGL